MQETRIGVRIHFLADNQLRAFSSFQLPYNIICAYPRFTLDQVTQRAISVDCVAIY